MKLITKELLSALELFRGEYPTILDAAKSLGISDSYLSRVLKGKTVYFSDGTWKKLEPKIKCHLSNACPHGYDLCPWKEAKLEPLLKNILSINEEEWYGKLNDLVQKEKSAYRKGHSHESGT